MTNSKALQIQIPREAIAQLCRDYHICKLAFFGSVLRDDFRPDSDIDILIEFQPGKTPGFGFIDIQDRLSELLGRTVDLNTPQDLSRYFRDRVLSEAEVIYG
ncbi:MAG: nucleotidyltransferase [Oscillatoriaceae cyanobacterium]|uniref:nucleotidyltransferase family protein n=1 Tax=[Phormidium] sp. ETS-05 TaxID=222819 RepID=UPI0018EF2361|nr:nucleotidyltransferase family protein [[Phormidium] sp. ETS-05]